MPFGQAGFTLGQAGGGFLGGLSGVLEAATPLLTSIFARGGGGAQPGGFPAMPAGFPSAMGLTLPGTTPGTALGELFGGGVPPLFRPTMTRIVPVPEFSLIGPDGKCHTWLHARPKGWKINRTNVSGRRRRHHHP